MNTQSQHLGHFLKLFPAQLWTDFEGMTDAQVGAVIRVICRGFLKGGVVAQLSELAELTGMQGRESQLYEIIEFFCEITELEDGQISGDFRDIALARQAQASRARNYAEMGRKGGLAKAEKVKQNQQVASSASSGKHKSKSFSLLASKSSKQKEKEKEFLKTQTQRADARVASPSPTATENAVCVGENSFLDFCPDDTSPGLWAELGDHMRQRCPKAMQRPGAFGAYLAGKLRGHWNPSEVIRQAIGQNWADLYPENVKRPELVRPTQPKRGGMVQLTDEDRAEVLALVMSQPAGRAFA